MMIPYYNRPQPSKEPEPEEEKFEELPEPEPKDMVIQWRSECLVVAGLAEQNADMIAYDRSIDLHYALMVVASVLAAGKPAELAVKILV